MAKICFVFDTIEDPWRNHPVFVAQHATATCCRGCVEKTNGIAKATPSRTTSSRTSLAVFERRLTSPPDLPPPAPACMSAWPGQAAAPD